MTIFYNGIFVFLRITPPGVFVSHNHSPLPDLHPTYILSFTIWLFWSIKRYGYYTQASEGKPATIAAACRPCLSKNGKRSAQQDVRSHCACYRLFLTLQSTSTGSIPYSSYGSKIDSNCTYSIIKKPGFYQYVFPTARGSGIIYKICII